MIILFNVVIFNEIIKMMTYIVIIKTTTFINNKFHSNIIKSFFDKNEIIIVISSINVINTQRLQLTSTIK